MQEGGALSCFHSSIATKTSPCPLSALFYLTEDTLCLSWQQEPYQRDNHWRVSGLLVYSGSVVEEQSGFDRTCSEARRPTAVFQPHSYNYTGRLDICDSRRRTEPSHLPTSGQSGRGMLPAGTMVNNRSSGSLLLTMQYLHAKAPKMADPGLHWHKVSLV